MARLTKEQLIDKVINNGIASLGDFNNDNLEELILESLNAEFKEKKFGIWFVKTYEDTIAFDYMRILQVNAKLNGMNVPNHPSVLVDRNPEFMEFFKIMVKLVKTIKRENKIKF